MQELCHGGEGVQTPPCKKVTKAYVQRFPLRNPIAAHATTGSKGSHETPSTENIARRILTVSVPHPRLKTCIELILDLPREWCLPDASCIVAATVDPEAMLDGMGEPTALDDNGSRTRSRRGKTISDPSPHDLLITSHALHFRCPHPPPASFRAPTTLRHLPADTPASWAR